MKEISHSLKIAGSTDVGMVESVAAALIGIRLPVCASANDDAWAHGFRDEGELVLRARQLAVEGSVEELLRMDNSRREHGATGGESALDAVGRDLLGQLASARHVRLARKVLDAGGGTLPVAFGIRCAAFHIVPLVAVAAYGVLRRMLSFPDYRGEAKREAIEIILDGHPQILTMAKEAVENMRDMQPRFRCA